MARVSIRFRALMTRRIERAQVLLPGVTVTDGQDRRGRGPDILVALNAMSVAVSTMFILVHDPEHAPMKAVTCRHLRGPFEKEHHGGTADEIIRAEDTNLEEMAANRDDAHRPARNVMKSRWRHPVSGTGRHRQAKKDAAERTEQR